MTFETRTTGSTTVVALHGALTSNDSDPGLRAAVRAAVDEGARTIILNLQDVSDVDSCGVAALASAHLSAANRGGRLAITDLPWKLRHLFAITRLDTVFDIFETEAEAMAARPLQ